MCEVAIVYFSGFGHTAKQAEAVRQGVEGVCGAKATLYRISDAGELAEADLEAISQADAIIYGSPTYMGGPPWQFKRFADGSSKTWYMRAWKDKLAAGFTNSGATNGDKFSTIQYFWTFSQQHGQIWVGTGLLPASKKTNGPGDVNWAGGFAGALAISPSDASADEAPSAGDLDTARQLGRRVADLANRIAA